MPSSTEPTHKLSQVSEDLDKLLSALPPCVAKPLRTQDDVHELLEIVLDLGRIPTARFLNREMEIGHDDVMTDDLHLVADHIGDFGKDNRAGIERTLHRISAIRNRKGKIVGLTARVGRAVFGTIKIIDDLVQSGQSILLLGRPGVGKTTMLREIARVLADEHDKRVVVVDTSNEIAGDGDIPHHGIGRARRMQVPTPALQHEVMIEAVENHMPQVIIIDEIGRELEAHAARTIAERGVQLVATAHGNSLENLVLNPTLSDLIGGIQSVTLGDEEARRRRTQKSILERKAPPTFDVLVEIQSWDRVAVHASVAKTVDAVLRGNPIAPESRSIDKSGELTAIRTPPPAPATIPGGQLRQDGSHEPKSHIRVFLFGVNRSRAEQVVRSSGLPIDVITDARHADAVITTKAHYRNRPQTIRSAESASIPVYVLRKNTGQQIEQCLVTIAQAGAPERSLKPAVSEAEQAAVHLKNEAGDETIELLPQRSYIRRLQHQVAERSGVESRSAGREPFRRVRLYRS